MFVFECRNSIVIVTVFEYRHSSFIVTVFKYTSNLLDMLDYDMECLQFVTYKILIW